MADVHKVLRDALGLDVHERATLAERLLADVGWVSPQGVTHHQRTSLPKRSNVCNRMVSEQRKPSRVIEVPVYEFA